MIRKRKIKNAFTKEIQPDGSSINIIDPYTGCQIQCPYCFQMGDRNWSKDIFIVMTKGEQDKKIYHWINSCYPQYSSHYKKILFEKDETYYNNLFERYRNDSNIYFMTNIWEV